MIIKSASELGYIPRRIISLVPSQTELLYDLGLDEKVVGITKFCIHPDIWFRNKTRVGGTKTVNKAIVDQLRPDLIIANKEENVKEQVEALATEYPVWVTDVNNLADALQMITDIGEMINRKNQSELLAESISKGFNELIKLRTKNEKRTTAYLIWKDPYMAAGGDTFINDMLCHCGFSNIFAKLTRYPEIKIAELSNANCQLLLLSSEPYPFSQNHIDELAAQVPGTQIMLVDGELFSWYGSRLLRSPAYFRELRSIVEV